LVDHLENSQIGNLVGAEVNKVGNKPRSQDSSAAGECACIEEPGEEKSSVSIGGQLDTVESDSSGEHALLILGSVVAF
jgi:hypothetical protein